MQLREFRHDPFVGSQVNLVVERLALAIEMSGEKDATWTSLGTDGDLSGVGREVESDQ